jgi:hypothetical protein
MSHFSDYCGQGVKVAKLYAPPPLSPELGPQTFLPSVISHAQEALIGKPMQAAREVAAGTALHPGSYTRYSMFPVPPAQPGASGLEKALRYVGPGFMYLPSAMSAYGAVTGPEEERSARMGEAVGSALGTAAGSPFGYLGNMIGSMLGANLGQRVGATLGG